MTFVVAAPVAAAAERPRTIVSPRPGQVIRADKAAVRIRARQVSRLDVRLNGVPIGGQLGESRRGLRGLRASISQGLRRGANVLSVVLDRRGARRDVRARVRFTVRPGGPMLGAGRDRDAGVGRPIRLLGEVDGAAGAALRWSVVKAPRSGVPGEGSDESARLLSPAGPSASFLPEVPGTYTLQMSAGVGGDAGRDLVKIDAMPRNHLVVVDTMAGGDKQAERGIRVGGTLFKAIDADENEVNSGLQVLVLDRDDLRFVSNTQYADTEILKSDLEALGSDKLVIAAMQPGDHGVEFERTQLNKAMGPIGMPDYGALPERAGSWSVIGVPGLDRGYADVNVLRQEEQQRGPLVGYLLRDQHGSWGYAPSAKEAFAYEPKPKPACTDAAATCLSRVGFRVTFQNARTLAPESGAVTFFNTGSANETVALNEVANMAITLEQAPFVSVVKINAVSERLPGESSYRPPVAAPHSTSFGRLAKAVASVGGSRNAFNRIAFAPGALSSGGLTYALVGWQGAGERDGAEAAPGVFGAVDATLIGTLRPELQSLMRPAALTLADNGPDLTDAVMTPPTNVWPLDDDPGASRALRYLGSTQKALGPDPRSAYWIQPFEAARWGQLATEIDAVQWRRLPEAARDGFSQDDFEDAQEQLVQELRWVANVREYLTAMANPFDENIFKSWADAQDTADEIYEDAHAGDSTAATAWTQFVSIALKLGGVFTFGVTTELGLLLDLGMWMAGQQPDGKPTVIGTKVKADEVGTQLAGQLRNAAQSIDQLGEIIVTDPAKLKLVGEEAGCNPTDPQCNQNYSLTRDAKRRVSADIARSVERYAYERLLPLGYHVFNLALDTSDPGHGGKARGAEQYYCGATGTWDEFSPTALKLSTASLLQELDPIGQRNVWQVLVMSQPLGSGYHGTPPPDRLLNRLFSPVPTGKGAATTDPEAGGLGMSPEALLASSFWDDGRSTCHWTG